MGLVVTCVRVHSISCCVVVVIVFDFFCVFKIDQSDKRTTMNNNEEQHKAANMKETLPYIPADIIKCLVLYTSTDAGENICNTIFSVPNANKRIFARHLKCTPGIIVSEQELRNFITQFDVLVYDSCNTSPCEFMGDVLHDFVCSGKSLVLYLFSNYGSSGQCLTNKFRNSTLHPLTYDTFSCPPNQYLDKIHIVNHPILQNVKTYDGGSSSSHVHGKLRDGSVLVASWNNGYPLVSYRQEQGKGMVVSLNTFGLNEKAPSAGFCWKVNTDGTFLIATTHYSQDTGSCTIAFYLQPTKQLPCSKISITYALAFKMCNSFCKN